MFTFAPGKAHRFAMYFHFMFHMDQRIYLLNKFLKEHILNLYLCCDRVEHTHTHTHTHTDRQTQRGLESYSMLIRIIDNQI